MFGLEILIKKNINTFFNKKKDILIITGPLGHCLINIPKSIVLKKRKEILILAFRLNKDKALFFTFCSLIRQKILGVYIGYYVILVIKGIGWQVFWKENGILCFKLGFSTLINYIVPWKIEIIVLNKQKLKIFGLDFWQVKQVVSCLCQLSKVDRYKGNGIMQQGEIIRLKTSSKYK